MTLERRCTSSDFRVLSLRVMMQMMTTKMAVRTTTSSTATTEMAAGRTKLSGATETPPGIGLGDGNGVEVGPEVVE